MIQTVLGLLEAAIGPAIIAAILLITIWRIGASRGIAAWAYVLAFAAAYLVGNILTVSFDVMVELRSGWSAVPVRSSDWMFYLVALAAVLGAVGSAVRALRVLPMVFALVVALAAAWLLTNRPLHSLPRPVWFAIISAYLFLLANLLEPLSRRVAPGPFLALLGLTSAVMAAMTSYYINQTHGQLLSGAAAALVVCALFAWLTKRNAGVCGICLCASTVLGGWASVELLSAGNLAGLMLIPAAPLGFWVGSLGPVARLRGGAAFSLHVTATVLILAAAAILLRIFVGN